MRVTGYLEGAERTPDNERTVIVPGRLLPEVVQLRVPDFDAWLDQTLTSPGDMVRVQTLDRYGDEDEYVEAYHRGEPGPTDADLGEWGAALDAHHLAGQTYRNLHLINGGLSRNLRMQFDWAYRFNIRHHMQVRVLDVSDMSIGQELLALGDFWVVNHNHVVLCRYDTDGRPDGHVQVEAAGAAGYRATAELAWQLGTDFGTWWAQHPQYHRSAQRAA